MSEFAQFSAGPAADGAKPARPATDYAESLAGRLRRLEAGRSTGILPFSGRSDGAVYLRAGRVVGAESSRTPGFSATFPQTMSWQPDLVPTTTPLGVELAPTAVPEPLAAGAAPETLAAAVPQALAAGSTSPSDPSPNGRPAAGPAAIASAKKSVSGLLAQLLHIEPAIDAVLDLVLSQSAIGRFRTGKAHGEAEPISLSVDSLEAEIARRLHLVRQMASVVTADTAVSRSPRLNCTRVQVSALQWALLIRAGTATTSRTLARALGRSVFGTTTEVYRLIAMDLLSVADDAARDHDQTQRETFGLLEPCSGTLSFLRAVSDQKGDDGMPKLSDLLHQAGGGR